ncbi:MAG: ankyrin repeat domain-containing protein [Blastocatellia bacterium]
MDAKFHPAVQAIVSGNIEQLKSIIREQPSLATERSSRSHPTLLQCLVLDAKDRPNQIEMARVLIEAGADIDAPLIAAACIDNLEAVVALLDAGAAINGDGNWSPLEEALYWNFQDVVECLVRRGASIHNLRIAAGLGRVDCMQTFFDTDGTLKPETLSISSPFEKQREAQRSNDPLDVINNALIYACVSNRVEAVEFLMKKGAQVY